jgi:organic radical activating enzyme
MEGIAVALSSIQPLNGGTIAAEGESTRLVTTDERYQYAAQVELDLPGIEDQSRKLRLRVRVLSGVLGAGWLRQDGLDWDARGSAAPATDSCEIGLVVPVGTSGGRLVFDNWTEGGSPCVANIESIEIVEDAESRRHDAIRQYSTALGAEERGDIEAAVRHYRAAVRLDPGNTEAVAGLGRLRFVEPPQPFNDELRRRAPVDVCQVVVEIRNPCNYRCFYCVATGKNNQPVQHFDLPAVERAYSQIDAEVIFTSYDCGGGEPTVHPQFPGLLRICAARGAVDFPTNNSQNPERWLPRDVAGRMLIRATLHPEAEPDIDRYLRHARYLIDAGCDFQSLYIAHPTRIAKMAQYAERFAEYGVPFTPISFMGWYEGRSYPHSYTEEEKHLVGLAEDDRFWAHKIEPHVTRIRNFRGIPCIAGYRSIYVLPDGRIRRCVYDGRSLPAPLQQPEPCGVNHCGCGLFLDKLNTIQTLGSRNFWGQKVGLPWIATEWMDAAANSIGHPGASEALAAEGVAMYDALMAAYGKDEFPEPVGKGGDDP